MSDEKPRKSVTLSMPTVALIAASIALCALVALISVWSMYHAYVDQRNDNIATNVHAACRSNLAVAVDVTKGPILLTEGDLLIHLVDAVVNRSDSKALLLADVQAFNAVRPAYEKALAERAQTEETCK